MSEIKEKTTVGAVLVNWNGSELTIPCIKSLLAGSMVPDRIIVIDNASTDGSLEDIAAECPEATIIRNCQNSGFAGGNNIGILQLIDEGLDYIWVLNNDTEVDRDCLAVLFNYMEKESSMAGCCGKILYHDQQDLIWYAGAIYNPRLITVKHKGQLQKDKGQYDLIEETPFITGCCMFIRARVWQRIGLFDERFFAYSEDLDWCLRAGDAKLQLVYNPHAIVYHKVSSSMKKLKRSKRTGSTPAFATYLSNRNRFFILRKHSPDNLVKLKGMTLHISWILFYIVALLMILRWTKAVAVFRAAKDGILTKLNYVGIDKVYR